MLRFTANRKLSTALENMEAPMKLINMQSLLFQEIVSDVQSGYMSADDGARLVLHTLYSAFDQQIPRNTGQLQ